MDVFSYFLGRRSGERSVLKITTQPASLYLPVDDSAAFSVAATGDSITYQWQSSADGTTWSDISGETGATLTVTVAAGLDGYYYRCVLTDGNGATLTSSAATLTVKYIPDDLASITATAVEGKIVVSWPAAARATSYRVARQTPVSSWTLLSSAYTDTTYDDTDVVTDTQYRYTVRPVNDAGTSNSKVSDYVTAL